MSENEYTIKNLLSEREHRDIETRYNSDRKLQGDFVVTSKKGKLFRERLEKLSLIEIRFKFNEWSTQELREFCSKYFTGRYAVFSNSIFAEFEKDVAKFLFYHDTKNIYWVNYPDDEK